jgi:hypothetical protein
MAFTALSLLSAVVGCHHTAGMCDCSNGGEALYGTSVSAVISDNGGIATASEGSANGVIGTAAQGGGALIVDHTAGTTSGIITEAE